MSVFTDLSTLRNHLQTFDMDAISVHSTAIILSGIDDVQLPHNALAEGSVSVYTQHTNTPAGPVIIALSGENWYATGYDAALPDSAVVADDEYPVECHVEGLDYAFDDDNARIKRFAGGSIGNGATVYIWLIALTLLVEDVDYEINIDKGTIKRIATGSLPDPARVYVSYATIATRAAEGLLTQAIDDAEGKILARLKPEYDETSEDYGLIVGATELALSYVCDDLAGGVLARHGDSTSGGRAQYFLNLSRRYEERAFNSLTPFIRLPIPTASRRQQNTPPLTW